MVSEMGVYVYSLVSVFCQEGTMRRERALKVVLVVVGLIFSGLVYPLTMFVRQEPALAMMLSVYVTLGIFLLLAARNPSANRSLIAFTAWSSFAHAALMAVQAFRNFIARGEIGGRGRPHCHRCSPDRAGSGRAVTVKRVTGQLAQVRDLRVTQPLSSCSS